MRMFVLSCAALALSACGDPGPDTDADGTISMDEAQAEIERSDALKPQAGQYRATMELVELEAENAPPQAVDMMKQMMSRSFEYCLTQEEADRGFEQMARESQDDSCTFDRFDVEGGDIDAIMNCEGEGGETMRMTMSGTGTETTSDMTMKMEGNIPGQGEGRITMRTQHERIGDCDA